MGNRNTNKTILISHKLVTFIVYSDPKSETFNGITSILINQTSNNSAVILIITWNLQYMIRVAPDAGGIYTFEKRVSGKENALW